MEPNQSSLRLISKELSERLYLVFAGSIQYSLRERSSSLSDGTSIMLSTTQTSKFARIFLLFTWEELMKESQSMTITTRRLRFHGKLSLT
jgi:hypothetical protein